MHLGKQKHKHAFKHEGHRGLKPQLLHFVKEQEQQSGGKQQLAQLQLAQPQFGISIEQSLQQQEEEQQPQQIHDMFLKQEFPLQETRVHIYTIELSITNA